MVCKKDVITWFKGLKSYKRIDVMSTLLNLCLPFELRFLGTCLEHLGKKDFHELRQSENEANNLSELNSAELQCLSNQQVRTTLAVYVSLLYSCNYTCSNYVYKILTKNEDIHSVLKAAKEDTVLDDLLLIYTLAVNHPGFSVDQKLNLEKILTQLQEEERRLSVQTANRNKVNFVASSVQDTALDKPPPPIQGYITTIEDHFIGMTSTNPHCPPMPQHAHFAGEGVVGGGGGATLTSYPMSFPWALIPAQESSLSRTSSPNSGSPPPPRLKFPPPPTRAPPSTLPTLDQLRESIAKEIPAYATVLHTFSPEQLGRMCDEELREMGLSPSAVVQLRAILSKQTNGIGSGEPKKKSDTPTDHEQGVGGRLMEGGGGTLRRFPAEAVAVYPGVYSCVTLPPPRKLHQHPFYPAAAATAPQFDLRQMRITASEPSSSDESSPDTPPPQGEGVCAEERLTGGSGGGEDRMVGGRGRSRNHPPGRPAPQRARGPHPSTHSRRREMNVSNGAGNGGGGGGGGNDPSGGYYPPQGYLPPHYLRSPYPGGYPGYPTGGGGGGFVRAYPPAFQQPNGEVVYTTYPPPTGFITTGGYAPLGPQGQNQVLQQPPPPPPAPIQQPPNKPPPHSTSCYNCGSQSHCAIDCPDATIEEVTKQGQYRIDFSGGYQKPVTGTEQHAAEK